MDAGKSAVKNFDDGKMWFAGTVDCLSMDLYLLDCQLRACHALASDGVCVSRLGSTVAAWARQSCLLPVSLHNMELDIDAILAVS